MPPEQPGAAALILVDLQKGAITEDTRHILAPLRSFLDRHLSDFELTFATSFVNTPRGPSRTLLGCNHMTGPPDTDLCDLIQRPGIEVRSKEIYSAVDDHLLARLRTAGVSTVYLAGTDTDMCVLHTAVDLFEAALLPRILTNLCASTGGKAAHRAGIAVLRRCIGEAQLLDAERAEISTPSRSTSAAC